MNSSCWKCVQHKDGGVVGTNLRSSWYFWEKRRLKRSTLVIDSYYSDDDGSAVPTSALAAHNTIHYSVEKEKKAQPTVATDFTEVKNASRWHRWKIKTKGKATPPWAFIYFHQWRQPSGCSFFAAPCSDFTEGKIIILRNNSTSTDRQENSRIFCWQMKGLSSAARLCWYTPSWNQGGTISY